MSLFLSLLSTLWGIGGVIGLLTLAVVRLSAQVREAWSGEFSWIHWTVLAINSVFMAYSEGYRGFHLSFAPRVIARARVLRESPRPLRVLLAPFFCAGYFGMEWKQQRIIWGVTAGIFLLVWAVRELPQPWRGIVDAGVVVGLSLGILSIVIHGVTAMMHRQPNEAGEPTDTSP